VKKDLDKKKNLVMTSLLSRITDFQLQSQDAEFFDWIEDLRGALVDFSENKLIKEELKELRG
jgi:hypothetical protein